MLAQVRVGHDHQRHMDYRKAIQQSENRLELLAFAQSLRLQLGVL
jgi:hypothetical protein